MKTFLFGLLVLFLLRLNAQATSVMAFESAKPRGDKTWLLGVGVEFAQKDYAPLQEPYIKGWQTTDFSSKLTLARSYLFHSVTEALELQLWWAALHILYPRVNATTGGPKGDVGDLVIGFKYALWGTPLSVFENYHLPGVLCLKIQTKAPNSNEKWLIGTNNTDVAFGLMWDLPVFLRQTLQFYSGFNTVADPRHPNWQDDILDFRIAYSWEKLNFESTPLAWLQRLDLGLQGFRGYYRTHDLKGRLFAKFSWATDPLLWQQNKGWELATTFTTQILGDKADLGELFFFTENWRAIVVLNYLF